MLGGLWTWQSGIISQNTKIYPLWETLTTQIVQIVTAQVDIRL